MPTVKQVHNSQDKIRDNDAAVCRGSAADKRSGTAAAEQRLVALGTGMLRLCIPLLLLIATSVIASSVENPVVPPNPNPPLYSGNITITSSNNLSVRKEIVMIWHDAANLRVREDIITIGNFHEKKIKLIICSFYPLLSTNYDSRVVYCFPLHQISEAGPEYRIHD